MIDIHSPTWEAVSTVCEQGLASARKHIEASGTPIEATEHQRGVIAAFKAILELARPKEPKRLPTDIGSIQY